VNVNVNLTGDVDRPGSGHLYRGAQARHPNGGGKDLNPTSASDRWIVSMWWSRARMVGLFAAKLSDSRVAAKLSDSRVAVDHAELLTWLAGSASQALQQPAAPEDPRVAKRGD